MSNETFPEVVRSGTLQDAGVHVHTLSEERTPRH